MFKEINFRYINTHLHTVKSVYAVVSVKGASAVDSHFFRDHITVKMTPNLGWLVVCG